MTRRRIQTAMSQSKSGSGAAGRPSRPTIIISRGGGERRGSDALGVHDVLRLRIECNERSDPTWRTAASWRSAKSRKICGFTHAARISSDSTSLGPGRLK